LLLKKHTHTLSLSYTKKMISSIETTKSLPIALFAVTSRPSLSPFLSLFFLASLALAPLRLLLWGALFLDPETLVGFGFVVRRSGSLRSHGSLAPGSSRTSRARRLLLCLVPGLALGLFWGIALGFVVGNVSVRAVSGASGPPRASPAAVTLLHKLVVVSIHAIAHRTDSV